MASFLPSEKLGLLRDLVLFSLALFIRLVSLLLSTLFPPRSSRPVDPTIPFPSSSAARSLLHLLSLVPLIPITSRKYHFALSLADRLLRENLVSSLLRLVNHSALLAAFASTISDLEGSVYSPPTGPADLIAGAVRSGLRRIGAAEEEKGRVVDGEKLAGEVMWLAQRLVECGAGRQAVERWAAASGLARAALMADARMQAGLVRVSVFLLEHAHRMQTDLHQVNDDKDEDENNTTKCSQCCFSILCTWLPLLCWASNGIDAPISSGCDRTETTRMIVDMIETLKWEEQEEVLALWLYHFTSCPYSDWPNLESYYTKWYAESRKPLLS